MKVARFSALRTGRLYPPENIPGTHFFRGWVYPRAIVRPGGLCQWKNPVTPSVSNPRPSGLERSASTTAPPRAPTRKAKNANKRCLKYAQRYGWQLGSVFMPQTFDDPVETPEWVDLRSGRANRGLSSVGTLLERLQFAPPRQTSPYFKSQPQNLSNISCSEHIQYSPTYSKAKQTEPTFKKWRRQKRREASEI
jgi:hypothetical protein